MSLKATCFLPLFLLVAPTSLLSLVGDLEIKEVEFSLPRKDYSTVVLDNTVFFAGGRTNRHAVNTVDIYEPATEKWSRASLSEPRYLLTTITLDNMVFFAGGHLQQGRYSRTVDIYDKDKNRWASFKLSEARSHMTAYAASGKVFFVGGRIGSRNSNVVDIYDAATGTLERATLSQARYYPTVASINDNAILFAGGYLRENRFSDIADIYTLDTKQWKSIRLSEARDHLLVTPIADKILITGTDHDKSHTHTAVNIFTIASRTQREKLAQEQSVSTDDQVIPSDIGKEIIQKIMYEAPVAIIQERVDGQIETLRKESLQDSISKLDEVESYFWPGTRERDPYVPGFPLDPDSDQWDINAIMSNRRFLKVYQEISDISAREAAALLNKEIEGTLAQYQSLLAEYMLKNKPYFDSLKSGKMPQTGPILQIGNNKDGSPTLAGTRFKALSLVLMAGSLRLEGTKETVRTITAYALEQRTQLHADPFNSPMVSADFLRNFSLCNRQILATGVLGTSLSAEKEKQVLESMRSSKEEKVLTRYDAVATEYDLHSQAHEGPIPVDYAKGTTRVEYVRPITDSTFGLVFEHPEIGTKSQ